MPKRSKRRNSVKLQKMKSALFRTVLFLMNAKKYGRRWSINLSAVNHSACTLGEVKIISKVIVRGRFKLLNK